MFFFEGAMRELLLKIKIIDAQKKTIMTRTKPTWNVKKLNIYLFKLFNDDQTTFREDYFN